MKAAFCLIFTILSIGLTYAAIGDISGGGHGGRDLAAHELGSEALGGAGYGGRKGGVQTSGYDRGFSYGRGHDTAKSVSVGDEEFGGNQFGDKGIRESALRGLGYGGMGYGGMGYGGGFRAPLFFF